MPRSANRQPKTKILELLGENRVLSLATLRSDGWPQTTMVGYAHDDLTLYCAVGRSSQKLANIQKDPRVSIALGHDLPDRLRGLSMAAHAIEVVSIAEIDHLNALLQDRYPEQSLFSPRELSSAVLRITPIVISVIDLTKGPGKPELVHMKPETKSHHIRNTAAGDFARSSGGKQDGRADRMVLVRYTAVPAFRRGAPP
jgi:general stress protein 26